MNWICLIIVAGIGMEAANAKQGGQEELVFAKKQRSDEGDFAVNSSGDLERTLQNVVRIDQVAKENQKQTQKLNDCNARLSLLKSELTGGVSDMTATDMNRVASLKTPRYADIPVYNMDNSGSLWLSASASSASSPLFANSQIMQDIRKHFVNYLK